MSSTKISSVILEKHLMFSDFLKRDVIIDCYYHASFSQNVSVPLLLINDGQDLRTMHFEDILEDLNAEQSITMVFCAAIHCSSDRKNEYGTARVLDYKGRGAKAADYTAFVMKELLPFLRKTYLVISFSEKAFAGFSLGGLSAMDIAWNHPYEFTKVGVFSGSMWWRDKAQDEEDFDEDENRIMQRQVREGNYYSWMKFFFEVGTKDETADRNNNGVIDSIDDTKAVIDELKLKGYDSISDIRYLELEDGFHNVDTWARAFPVFLKWGWGKGNNL
ncbi:MAG: alpha/beta hydrolase-fold protein [Ferruginibacter sp.]